MRNNNLQTWPRYVEEWLRSVATDSRVRARFARPATIRSCVKGALASRARRGNT